MGEGGYDRISGGPGYSTLVELMRTGINRWRKHAAIIIKCSPKSYEFIFGRGGGGGDTCTELPPPPPPSGSAAEASHLMMIPSTPQL